MASYEWGFAIVMAILCVTLSGLQYQWTGDLGRAELARLKASLSESAQGFCQAFDRELAAGYQDLLPEAAELLRDGRDQVHLRHYQKWLASKPRPIFSHLAVVEREGDGLALWELDQRAGI